MNSLILTDTELCILTGYQRPAKQLEVLLHRGFHRAHINRAGVLILERAHYNAVCAGTVLAANDSYEPAVHLRTDHLRRRRAAA